MTLPGNCALVLDIDGVIRDVAGSYRRALADTVEHFTDSQYRPSAPDIDRLKQEGLWNNDWEAANELIRRFGVESNQSFGVDYDTIVTFFQSRYRGQNWDGYIAQENLLVSPEFFAFWESKQIPWGFFSGATRASATFVLHRLGLQDQVLVAMEDAPGKPDPTGLISIAEKFNRATVVYAGDTVADMLTVIRAKQLDRSRNYVAIGVIPPHVWDDPQPYGQVLLDHGADRVVNRLTDLIAQDLLEISN